MAEAWDASGKPIVSSQPPAPKAQQAPTAWDESGKPVEATPTLSAAPKPTAPQPTAWDETGKPIAPAKPEGLLTRTAKQFGSDLASPIKESVSQVQKDLANPVNPMKKPFSAVGHEIKLAWDAAGVAAAPAVSVGKALIGRPFETATGIKGSAEPVGALASVAVPFAGERAALSLAPKTRIIGEALQKASGPLSSALKSLRTEPYKLNFEKDAYTKNTIGLSSDQMARTPRKLAKAIQSGLGADTTKQGYAIAKVIRQNGGEQKLTMSRLEDQFKQFRKVSSKLSTEQRDRVYAYQEGKKSEFNGANALPQEHEALADALRTGWRAWEAQVRRTLNDEDMPSFVKDFVSHIWKENPDEVADAFAGRRPADFGKQGSARSTKARKFPTYAEGIEKRLTPKYDDPIDNFLAYSSYMSKYLAWKQTVYGVEKMGGSFKYPSEALPGELRIKGIGTEKPPTPRQQKQMDTEAEGRTRGGTAVVPRPDGKPPAAGPSPVKPAKAIAPTKALPPPKKLPLYRTEALSKEGKKLGHKSTTATAAANAEGENSFNITANGTVVRLPAGKDPHRDWGTASKFFPESKEWSRVSQYSDDKAISLGIEHPEKGFTEAQKKAVLRMIATARKQGKEIRLEFGEEHIFTDANIEEGKDYLRGLPTTKVPLHEEVKDVTQGRPEGVSDEDWAHIQKRVADNGGRKDPIKDEDQAPQPGHLPGQGVAKTGYRDPNVPLDDRPERPNAVAAKAGTEVGFPKPPEREPPQLEGPAKPGEADKAKKVHMQPRRQLFAPEDIAHVVNDFYSTGMQGRIGTVADTARKISNAQTMMLLGLSMFHLATMVKEGIAHDMSRFARLATAGIGKTAIVAPGKALRGKFGEAGSTFKAGVKNLGGAAKAAGGALASPVRTPMRGAKMQSQILEHMIPGAVDKKINNDFVRAGGGLGMDSVYKAKESRTFFDALSSGKFWDRMEALMREMQRSGGKIKENPATGTYDLTRNIIQSAAAPMFEWYIPHMKRGAFSSIMKDWYASHPNATEAEAHEASISAIDSVDNRFGEMNHDNIFWNKTLKQIAQIALLSYSWDLGTVREIAGGALEIPKSLKGVAKGEGVTDKTSYLLGLAATSAMINGAMTYMKTGKPPEEPMDYQAYKTGGKVQGNEERAITPGYEKDVYGFLHDPLQEAANKQSPFLKVGEQMLTGKDYRGMDATKPSDVPDMGKFNGPNLLDNFIDGQMPISVKQWGQPSKIGSNISPLERGLAVREAPAYMENPKREALLKKQRDVRDWERRIYSDEAQKAIRKKKPLK